MNNIAQTEINFWIDTIRQRFQTLYDNGVTSDVFIPNESQWKWIMEYVIVKFVVFYLTRSGALHKSGII